MIYPRCSREEMGRSDPSTVGGGVFFDFFFLNSEVHPFNIFSGHTTVRTLKRTDMNAVSRINKKRIVSYLVAMMVCGDCHFYMFAHLHFFTQRQNFTGASSSFTQEYQSTPSLCEHCPTYAMRKSRHSGKPCKGNSMSITIYVH